MRILTLATLLALLNLPTHANEDPTPHVPKLLLTAKLTKRLKRDQDRQTPRWINFETRIKTTPDSPERGFELALYYAVTGDTARAQEAITWAASHPSEIRQHALVLDWCFPQMTPVQRASFAAALAAHTPANTFQSRRDCLFANLATGRDTAPCMGTDLDTASLLRDSAELYAACEYFLTTRTNGGQDQRRDDPQFFQHLPVEFLLARKPQDVDHPDWRSHVAALALVSLDPNLEASQFLQGWAIEDRQTLREGPGVAYELLWADPYLPGIAYQNLDPWIYEGEAGRLFARSDWTADACWISISDKGLQQQGCPDAWQDKVVNFGTLKLIPISTRCFDIAKQQVRESVVVWKLKPGEKLTYHDNKDVVMQADDAGMWHPGTNVEGKVCELK